MILVYDNKLMSGHLWCTDILKTCQNQLKKKTQKNEAPSTLQNLYDVFLFPKLKIHLK